MSQDMAEISPAPTIMEELSSRKRVLIEASKLADRNMDGIRRYVVELLEAFHRMDNTDLPDIDVMIFDEVFTLEEAIAGLHSPSDSMPGQIQGASWAGRIVSLIPPALLYPIKWLIPAGVSRRFLGKEKSELQVPQFEPGVRQVIMLLLPPAFVPLLQKVIPERLVQFFWARGILKPLPRAVDPTPYDLVHHTLPNNCHFVRPGDKPHLVTVHDLCHIACPEFQTRANAFTLKMGLDSSVANGSGFLSVSDATREQLIDAYSLEPDRVITAHNGCNSKLFRPVADEETRRATCRKYGIPEKPYLLTLSTIEPRKNLARTIEAFSRFISEPGAPEINLVVAGPKGWKSSNIMHAAESSEHIFLTGYIGDEDLAALYSSARVFVYASHYEGFGLPLLEAMHCGIPVIYGNNSSMPEIVGTAGLPVDSRDTENLVHQMRRLVCDDDLAAELGRQGLERSGRFTRDHAAERTLTPYNHLLSQA